MTKGVQQRAAARQHRVVCRKLVPAADVFADHALHLQAKHVGRRDVRDKKPELLGSRRECCVEPARCCSQGTTPMRARVAIFFAGVEGGDPERGMHTRVQACVTLPDMVCARRKSPLDFLTWWYPRRTVVVAQL